MTLRLVSVAVAVAVGIMFAGVTGGKVVYRTILYTPHFVAGG
jgi:hypothetical protein